MAVVFWVKLKMFAAIEAVMRFWPSGLVDIHRGAEVDTWTMVVEHHVQVSL